MGTRLLTQFKLLLLAKLTFCFWQANVKEKNTPLGVSKKNQEVLTSLLAKLGVTKFASIGIFWAAH